MVLRERNLWKTCLSMLLVVTCFMTSLLFLHMNVNAENVIRTGVVEVTSSLNFRSGPGTEYGVVGYLYNGDTGIIEEEAPATNGKIWYKMTINGKTGWASSSYVRVIETVVKEDPEFNAYLTAQGFPETYKAQLQALHAQYPNWVFEAQHTNLNWQDAINAESSLARNLVHSGAATSWKSMQNGAYNWETGVWIEFDSGGWVAASTEIVQHFMDPRNFLDSTNIFQFIKQSYDASKLNEEQLAQKKTDLTGMVKGTYFAGTCPGTERPYVDVIMEAAAESGVCPFTLASMMIQEQGTDGSGRSISGTVPGYEGYYNYLNIGAYKTDTMSAVERGLWYASGSGSGKTSYRRPWDNATDSIIGSSIYYGEGFVKVGQDTLYLKKYNVQGPNIYGHQYMTNVQGAASEGKHMAKAYDENARQAALVFKIPVFKNMPEKPCPKPTDNRNPNYMLKSLSVTGYSLTPTFNMHETAYSLIVPYEASSVVIDAQAVASQTTIAGKGTHNLNVGANTIQVVSTAENGTQRAYTINIVRQEGTTPPPPTVEPDKPGDEIPTPSISSNSCSVNSDNTITGITTFPIAASDFASKFGVTNGSVKITTSSGADKSGNVGTGDQVRVYNSAGVHVSTYTIIIFGDTNGDGKINTSDYVQIRKQILATYSIQGHYRVAADTNRNGKVDTADYVQIRKQILGGYSIQQ